MCKKRCILPFLFAILSLRYRTVKIPSLLENTSEDELVLSRWRNLLARVKLDNFSFQHCKLFATSSLGGGYLPSSTTLYAVTWTIAFRFIPFFLSSAFSKMSLFAYSSIFICYMYVHIIIYSPRWWTRNRVGGGKYRARNRLKR